LEENVPVHYESRGSREGMKFTILSHAGLSVTTSSTELLFDPWLLGSCYWRSWWNYPPVDEDLVAQLHPTAIYLTHIHWDHFHGPSLKRFPKDTLLLVPKGNYCRIRRDLNEMGYGNIIELNHGETYRFDDSLSLTSYQFGPFLDSCAVVESPDTTLLNANDTKITGLPLTDMMRRHGKFDFVFRSHSSANSRLSFEYLDNADAPVDDIQEYIRSFADFCIATKATYAVPFASNHCFLHKDVYAFNDTIQTPLMVESYWREKNIDSVHLKVMLSGDSWDEIDGFKIAQNTFFSHRKEHLKNYQSSVEDKLKFCYSQEARAKIRLPAARKFFKDFSASIPAIFKYFFLRGSTYVFILKAGEDKSAFCFNLFSGTFDEICISEIERFDCQIHTSTRIFNQCVTTQLFSHLAISKRVKYKITLSSKSKLTRLNFLLNMYEYDLLPLHKNLSKRSITNWLTRWRELVLYIAFTKDLIVGRKIDVTRYLPK